MRLKLDLVAQNNDDIAFSMPWGQVNGKDDEVRAAAKDCMVNQHLISIPRARTRHENALQKRTIPRGLFYSETSATGQVIVESAWKF
ncbi:MAG: hypothetical protein L0Z73_10285 [Gammaproteobacteria bacterium]|nr:hypothetical protein [Gammaproteobacteria bacterium]